MKKIVLSLAGVMAAAAFAPEASALPVFARQTGMACSACHFQHFPLLNGFGRAFKAAGFTMMGAQGKIEGDRLSIPDTLNMAVLTSMGYEKTNMGPDVTGVTKNTGNGAIFVPGVAGEASLFIGGRVSDYAGFLSEIALAPTAALDSAKLPMLPEIGTSGTRLGIVPFATNAQGASYGMELLNTGANAVQQISNTPGFNGAHTNAISAQQYISTAGTATGAAIVANNDFGFINLTKYDLTGIAAGAPATLGSTYLRVVATFDMAGWDSAVGVQSWSGQSWDGVVGAPSVLVQTKATAIDGQMQGTLGEMPTGFYFSYAKAPASTVGGLQNVYAADPNAAAFAVANPAATPLTAGTLDRSSFNIDAEVGVIPEVVTLGAAIRRGKSGVADATGANLSDNAYFLTATYKIAQNMLARLSYTSQSGGYWDQIHTNAIGSKTTTINLYTLF
jgi:hypothetical protein